VLRYRSTVPKGTLVNVTVTVPGYPPATALYSTLGPASSLAPHGFLQSTAALLLLTLIVATLIGVAVWALTRRHVHISARVSEYMLPTTQAGGRRERERSLVELALGDTQARALQRSPRWRALATELDVAGIPIAPLQYMILSLIAVPIVAWIAYVLAGKPVAVLIGLGAPPFALWFARYRADKQRRLFDAQLPDNLSVVASAMRAGQTFMGALQAVVDTAPEPSKSELRRAVTDAQLGVPIDEALDSLGERLKSSDFQHVALIAQLQRETGGNTAEVVELVADTIRERLELKQMVRALTAQGRLAGLILSLLPVGLLVIVSVINPSYMHPMYHSTIGIIALIFAALMSIAGSLVIRRVVTIEL
jgi:tight adherence protein B